MNYGQHFNARQTPQTEAVPGKPMVKNNAGGYGFAVDEWARLDRFLVLGSEGGAYYVGERALTRENATSVTALLQKDGGRVVDRIVEISDAGRAPKNDPALFALALAASLGDAATKRRAFEALPKVARIPTHLFTFVEAAQGLRGWGKGMRQGVASWYATRKDLGYQLSKYQSRNGWSNRDLMRLSHFNRTTYARPELRDAYHWVNKGWEWVGDQPHPDPVMRPIWAFERAKRASKDEVVKLIREHRLVRECVPTQFLNDADVWDALLQDMPATAMVRNLGTMTRVGLLKPLSAAAKLVAERLNDVERLRKVRLHPLAVLTALKTYAQGHGEKSDKTWTPVPQVVAALDDAFYGAFQAVEPTGRRWLLGIDVSGSMSCKIAGSPLSCCEAATALALVTVRTERQSYAAAFNQGLREVPFNAKTSLQEALRHTTNINGGGTDCAMPMLGALQSKLEVDTFVVLTDNETWAGIMQPYQALRQYREATGIPAKLIVVGMAASNFTIADPADKGMLDVVGFDLAVPALMSDFAKE
jgi:60 kDa SS-A/Ro ribonucleoprotein